MKNALSHYLGVPCPECGASEEQRCHGDSRFACAARRKLHRARDVERMAERAKDLPQPWLIARMLTRGETVQTLAAEFRCSEAIIAKRLHLSGYSITGVKMGEKVRTDLRPMTTCSLCSAPCRSARRICQQCVGIATYPDHAPREDDALTGGEWRLDPRRRVLVWVQTEAEPDPITHLIACPTCRAGVTETCRTRNGHRTSDHPNRLIKRRCECGGELRPKARWCLPCATERKRNWGKQEVAA